eukprot:6810224-Karenia_brevis.AAC.1
MTTAVAQSPAAQLTVVAEVTVRRRSDKHWDGCVCTLTCRSQNLMQRWPSKLGSRSRRLNTTPKGARALMFAQALTCA